MEKTRNETSAAGHSSGKEDMLKTKKKALTRTR